MCRYDVENGGGLVGLWLSRISSSRRNREVKGTKRIYLFNDYYVIVSHEYGGNGKLLIF